MLCHTKSIYSIKIVFKGKNIQTCEIVICIKIFELKIPVNEMKKLNSGEWMEERRANKQSERIKNFLK